MTSHSPTILQSPFFLDVVLPFLLIFVVIFAILQKSKIFGEGKKQIDALVALVIGLIFIAFGNAVGIIQTLLPFLAVAVVIILVFLILYSMVFQGEDKFQLHKSIKVAIGIIIGIAVIIAVLVATGVWDNVINSVLYGDTGQGGSVFTNILFIAVIIAAIAVALWTGKEKGSE